MAPSSSSTAIPTCTCPDTADSPLSHTANILSILTFAFAIIASYIAGAIATYSAPAEIQRLVDDLRATQREINRTAEYIFSDMHSHDDSASASAAPDHIAGASSPHQELLYNEVQNLFKTSITLFYEADDLLKRKKRDPYGLWRRALFVVNRDHVAEKIARLEDQKARLGEIRTDLFMRRSARQEVLLRRIADSCSMVVGAAAAGNGGGGGGGEGGQNGPKGRRGRGLLRRNSVDASMMDGEIGWKSMGP
ncbi:MAG: hypothetical protein Q9210_001895 [Variospora velana]